MMRWRVRGDEVESGGDEVESLEGDGGGEFVGDEVEILGVMRWRVWRVMR